MYYFKNEENQTYLQQLSTDVVHISMEAEGLKQDILKQS